jgi:hypothetical protein
MVLARLRSHPTLANVVSTPELAGAPARGAPAPRKIIDGPVRSADVADDSTPNALTGVDRRR